MTDLLGRCGGSPAPRRTVTDVGVAIPATMEAAAR